VTHHRDIGEGKDVSETRRPAKVTPRQRAILRKLVTEGTTHVNDMRGGFDSSLRGLVDRMLVSLRLDGYLDATEAGRAALTSGGQK
jgi:hypothetical protein